MRIIWQSCLWLLILFMTWHFGYPLYRKAALAIELYRGVSADYKEYLMGIGYVIDRSSSTEFSVPPGTENLRVILNGTMKAGQELAAEDATRFGLEYVLLDSSRQELFRGTWFFADRITRFVDDSGRTYVANRYEEDNLQAMDRRKALFYLGPNNEVAFLRLHLTQPDPRLLDVTARVYVPLRLTPGKERIRWQRMNRSQRESASQASILEYPLLGDEEIMAMVREQWQPIGPTGIKGEGYQLRRIFSLEENEGENIEMESMVFADKPIVGPGRNLTVPLPPEPLPLKLILTPFPNEQQALKDEVRLTLYQDPALPPQTFDQNWSGNHLELDIRQHLGGGLAEISAASFATVQFFCGDTEITPLPYLLPTWLADGQQSVSFQINGPDLPYIPFRLNSWTLTGEQTGLLQLPNQVLLHYRAFDEGGKLLFQGQKDWQPQASVHDYLELTGLQQLCSDPLQLFFHLPASTARFEVSASQPVLVNGALRPPHLPYTLKLPEDYQNYREENDTRFPAWFLIDPEQTQNLRVQRRNLTLRGQPRPPEPNHLLLSGAYEVEEYQPLGNQRFLQLLETRTLSGVFRPESAGSAFTPVLNGSQTLEFVADPSGVVSPTLLFLSSQQQPVPIKVFVDELLLQDLTLSTSAGELALGPLPPGSHQLSISAGQGTRLFLNHLIPDQDYLRRVQAVRLGSQSLEWDIVKPDTRAMTLGGLVFAAAGSDQSVILDVVLEAHKSPEDSPGTSFTHRYRRFEIQPAREAIHSLPPRRDFTPGAGVPFFIPLEEDLAPGTYRLKVTALSGGECWLRLSRLGVDINPKREIKAVPAVDFDFR